jgi:hypothetical protein
MVEVSELAFGGAFLVATDIKVQLVIRFAASRWSIALAERNSAARVTSPAVHELNKILDSVNFAGVAQNLSDTNPLSPVEYLAACGLFLIGKSDRFR